MTEQSIYQLVRDKLITHGVMKTDDGLITLNDKVLFGKFVKLERSKREPSFDEVLAVAAEIDTYLISIGKRQVMAFVFMYLHFSDLTVSRWELDEALPDGRVRKSGIFLRDVSDEERLIGLWATVKYRQIGESYLQTIYRSQRFDQEVTIGG
ncbi:hypothetical protein [Sulfitobacter mediterraneus]|uniref:Uncharacterized protein n=1 Tax=Sulfitobacter mediterraneus TaxID=83219 RepID=A0A2T6CAR6_9RHOB|nr:hypothetical protein [Sulfitobacter mediterraneus]KIN79142.1 hypothetical protein Z950_3147 [Sulfitobacter mediterraneus KCTC 32188]PTX72313.1 hypothetical protein C8N31_11124 [Sulfitobacter mediterraneus]